MDQINKEDTISRQAAIDAMKDRRDSAKEWYDNADDDDIRIRADSAMASFIECILTLKKLPSAQPLVLHCTECEDWHTKQGISGIAVSELPSAKPDKGYIEQIKWERDTAIAQLKELDYGLGEKIRTDTDTISRQAAIDGLDKLRPRMIDTYERDGDCFLKVRACDVNDMLQSLPSAQPEQTRVFVELVVEYLDPELCPYKEYRGKPYYSIKYIENGETYVGYGTYKPEVLSQYLREYFMQSSQADWEEMMVICDNCGHAIHVKRAERREG